MRITSLLKETFFGPCSVHEQKKNDLNYFCVDCESAVCRHCISTDHHNQHDFLQIYRYSYRDAIRIEDMKKHIDCSQIQIYTCNKQKVIVLNPLPYSGSNTDDDDNDCCNTCQRKLIDAKRYTYCSITCKAEASSQKSDGPDIPLSALPDPPNKETKQPKRSGASRRKGIPHRAPMK